jgi:hypothetical protein
MVAIISVDNVFYSRHHRYDRMRTAIKLLTVFNCIIFSPLIVIALTFHYSPISIPVVKEQLVANKVYEKASTAIQTQVDTMEQDAADGDPIFFISPLIKKEITETYIQNKSETLLADIDTWINKNGPPPVVSFKDLKDKLVAKNSSIISQIQDALKEMEREQESLRQAAKESGQEGDMGEVPSFSTKDFDKFLTSDWVIPVGANIGWVKTFVSVSRVMEIALLVFYVISFLCLIFLSQTTKSKIRWISMTVFFIALWNIPGIFISMGVSIFVSTYISQHFNEITFAIPFIQTLLTPTVNLYTKVSTAVVIASCIWSVGMFILSFFAGGEGSPHAAIPQVKKKIKRTK